MILYISWWKKCTKLKKSVINKKHILLGQMYYYEAAIRIIIMILCYLIGNYFYHSLYNFNNSFTEFILL